MMEQEILRVLAKLPAEERLKLMRRLLKVLLPCEHVSDVGLPSEWHKRPVSPLGARLN
jgi:hypothetical protein